MVRSGRITQESGNIVYAQPSDKVLARRLNNGVYRMDLDGLYKRCYRCLDYWPADTEFFNKQKGSTDGLSGWCKACYLEWKYPNGRRGRLHSTGSKAGAYV